MLTRIILIIASILVGRYAVKTLVSIYESKLHSKISELRSIVANQNQNLAKKQYDITNLGTLLSDKRNSLRKMNEENHKLKAKIENLTKNGVPKTNKKDI